MPADCNQQQALCARFGVGPDAEGESPGLPHILWFKGGKEVGGRAAFDENGPAEAAVWERFGRGGAVDVQSVRAGDRELEGTGILNVAIEVPMCDMKLVEAVGTELHADGEFGYTEHTRCRIKWTRDVGTARERQGLTPTPAVEAEIQGGGGGGVLHSGGGDGGGGRGLLARSLV